MTVMQACSTKCRSGNVVLLTILDFGMEGENPICSDPNDAFGRTATGVCSVEREK